MRLLVTGASGFIGRNFLLGSDASWTIDAVYRSASDFPAFLARHGLHHVIAHRCDLSVAEQVLALADGLPQRFHTILYLAANADPAASEVDPVADAMAGPVALTTLLSAVRCERLVYFSSGAVYEGLRGEVSPDVSVTPCLPYAVSRVTCEHYVRWFRHSGRVRRYVILRFFGAYGPFEAARKIYTRLVRWAATGAHEPFEIRGDGRNLIDAMYISDAVRGIRQVLDCATADEVVDFATEKPLTINELVDRAAHVLDVRQPKIRHVGTVPEYREFFPSTARMERLFDFKPKVPLEWMCPECRGNWMSAASWATADRIG